MHPSDAAYESLWTPFLKDFEGHVKAKGWADCTYIGIDERPPKEIIVSPE